MCHVHADGGEHLSDAVVELAGDAAALFILDLQEPRGKLTDNFRLPNELEVFDSSSRVRS